MSAIIAYRRLCGLLLAGTLVISATAASFDVAAQGRHGGGHAAHGHRGGGHGVYGHRGGGHWGGHHHGGHGWGGLALGIGLGALILSRPWDPVIVERPIHVYADPPYAPPPDHLAEARPVPPRVAEPIVYPSQGQSTDRLEADRQACNRWATTQPSAMADASVFHRATMACLEGRGYTVR